MRRQCISRDLCHTRSQSKSCVTPQQLGDRAHPLQLVPAVPGSVHAQHEQQVFGARHEHRRALQRESVRRRGHSASASNGTAKKRGAMSPMQFHQRAAGVAVEQLHVVVADERARASARECGTGARTPGPQSIGWLPTHRACGRECPGRRTDAAPDVHRVSRQSPAPCKAWRRCRGRSTA